MLRDLHTQFLLDLRGNVPRSKPVSQRDIKAREDFGLGPVAERLKGDKSGAREESGLGSGAASPSRLNRKKLPSWDFSEPKSFGFENII
jgi:hypothetical protein